MPTASGNNSAEKAVGELLVELQQQRVLPLFVSPGRKPAKTDESD